MILAIDGTNWIHTLWHAVGDRAPRLAAGAKQLGLF